MDRNKQAEPLGPGDYLFHLAERVTPLAIRLDQTSTGPHPGQEALVALLAYLKTYYARSDGFRQATYADQRKLVQDALGRKCGLQPPLAALVSYTPSKWLLEQEAPTICQVRRLHGRSSLPWSRPASTLANTGSDQSDVHTWAAEMGLRGLCLSGGGIRSATFNLGILQGLAARQKLNDFDYLSSVSGGGYIQAWLAAWLKRESERRQLASPIYQAAQNKALAAAAAAKAAVVRKQSADDLATATAFMAETPEALLGAKQAKASATQAGAEAARASIHASAAAAAQAEALVSVATEALGRVLADLTPIPDRNGNARSGMPVQEILWLRRYSNYLTPEKGLLTLDTWTAFAIWLRNTLLNQVVLIAALLALLLGPWLLIAAWPVPHDVAEAAAPPRSALNPVTLRGTLVYSQARASLPYTLSLAGTDHASGSGLSLHRFKADFNRSLHQEAHASAEASADAPVTCSNRSQEWARVCTIFALIGFLWSAFSLGLMLREEHDFTRRLDKDHRKPQDDAVSTCGPPAGSAVQERPECRGAWKIVGGLMLPALPLCFSFCCPGADLVEVICAAAALLCLSLCVACGGQSFCIQELSGGVTDRSWFERAWRQLLTSVAATVAGTTLFVLAAALIHTATIERWGAGMLHRPVPTMEVVLGVPLLATIPFLTLSILIGLVGRSFFDWLLEVLGRILAINLLITVGWISLFAIALLSPGLFLAYMHTTALKVSSIVSWIATTALAVASGRSDKITGSATDSAAPSKTMAAAELIAAIGPYVYILGLLILLSLGIETWIGDTLTPGRVFLGALLCLAISVLLGSRLDVNALSLFPFYRNRLTRCYLGASNRARDANPLTGFDDRDTRGLQLRCLTPETGYPGPFPIFCATLNLTTGEDLAYQERKGASFAFTPLYTGYAVSWTAGAEGTQFNGFVPTSLYAAVDGGLNIASAMAISGAALSPNSGYHTKPATAFLMTMFNARLGCWLPNTRREPAAGRRLDMQEPPRSELKSPTGAILFAELLGNADDSHPFIYLTDGGHFDNMGLYELVRRRCYDITVCDAEQDQSYTFEGIGSAIRKCRIDFGVEIDLNLSQLRTVAKTRFSSAHMVQGTVRYPEATEGRIGKIRYIKASLVAFGDKTGTAGLDALGDLPNVPGDVQNYVLQHANFPQDSTLNQWFTESQFESYRRLGQCVVESMSL